MKGVQLQMRNSLFLGVSFTLCSTFFYSIQAAMIKAYAESIPLSVVIFIQCLIGFLLFVPYLFKKGLPGAKKIIATNKLFWHSSRALISLGISFGLFASIKYIPFVNAVLFANTAPLMVPFVAALLLGSRINHSQWMPILIGFLGIALVLQPSVNIFHPGIFLALFAALMSAAGVVVIRKISLTDSGDTVTFYLFLLSTLFVAFPAIKFWVPIVSFKLWGILLGTGILYAISQYFVIFALRFANPQLVCALFYTNIVFSALISIFIWKVVPNALTVSGIILTVLGGVLCIRAEHVQQVKLRQAELSA